MLWAAIHALQWKEPDVISVVYSGDTDATKEKIIDKVQVCTMVEYSIGFVALIRNRLALI